MSTELTMPEWGLKPSELHKFMWGARAIMEGRDVALLGDRQGLANPQSLTPEEREAFFAFVDLVMLLVRMEARSLDGSSRRVVEFKADSATVRCSTNASGGYLYIGVWAYTLPMAAPFGMNATKPVALESRTLAGAKREASKGRARETFNLTLFGQVIARHTHKGWLPA